MKHICLLFDIEQTVPLDMYFIKMIIFVLFTYNLIKLTIQSADYALRRRDELKIIERQSSSRLV